MRYAHGVERLKELEALAEAGELRLFYGDESHVCQQGDVPYGWQFADEDVFVPAQKGFRLNCWGLFSRDNRSHWATTSQNITAAFVRDRLEELSWQLTAPTVVVLDNARIHTAALIQHCRSRWALSLPVGAVAPGGRCRSRWAQRDLHLFFLPTYSPHLNIAETVWRHLKGGWLQPTDYAQADKLAYATNRCLANFGKALTIKFSPFKST